MRRIIYPSGHFECELIHETPEPEYGSSPYWRVVSRPSFQLIKTSLCVVRYETDSDDFLILLRLQQTLKTPFDVANHLATKEEAEASQKSLGYFGGLLNKAKKGVVEKFEGMQYIETSDSHTLHSYAKYHYAGDVIQQDFPCKVGEPLIHRLDPETLNFYYKHDN